MDAPNQWSLIYSKHFLVVGRVLSLLDTGGIDPNSKLLTSTVDFCLELSHRGAGLFVAVTQQISKSHQSFCVY